MITIYELEDLYINMINRGKYDKNFATRIKRALSWLERAEKKDEDEDARVIFLWIAFNALYSDWMVPLSESEKQTVFLGRFDDFGGDKIHQAIREKCSAACVKLYSNRYICREYWERENKNDTGINIKHGLKPGLNEEELEENMENVWKEKECNLYEESESFVEKDYKEIKGDASSFLVTLFDRIYMLRNQVVHGGATWNRDVNRDQVQHGCEVLEALIPVFVELMLKKPKAFEVIGSLVHFPPYRFWNDDGYYTRSLIGPDVSKVGLAIPQSNAVIFGFDSAWTDKSPGAICAIAFDAQSNLTFHEPCLVSFSEALEFIKDKRQGHDFSLVAIDQPTVVPNETGSRPVEKVAGSQISFVGGGVQPANRGKKGMFCGDSPIWSFLSGLNSRQKPMDARTATNGHFLVEVFPALALSALHSDFAKRNAAPKYNPANKRKFRLADWRVVARVVAGTARQLGIVDLASWADGMGSLDKPGKADQDCMDASICALVGLLWRGGPASHSAMLGDVDTGYMITPVSDETKGRLESAAHKRDVPFRMPQSKK